MSRRYHSEVVALIEEVGANCGYRRGWQADAARELGLGRDQIARIRAGAGVSSDTARRLGIVEASAGVGPLFRIADALERIAACMEARR